MTTPFDTPDADLFPGEGGPERFAAARAAFRGSRVTDPDSAAFDEAHGAMDAFFGPRNEIERRPILQDWLRNPLREGPLRVDYHLLAWHDVSGALAGVRDAFVGVDTARGLCGVLLSHSFVPETHRRSGVATLIRTSPATLARAGVAAAGLPAHTPIALCAEMEPCVPADRGSIVRLVSYGRSGYASVPPSVLPYCQPDFRDLVALGVPAAPIPMPLVVRWLGHEHDGVLRTDLAATLVTVFSALHLRACEPTHVVALADAEHGHLRAWGRPTLPLNVLPTSFADLDPLIPLLRSRALPHYPPALRGDLPDPDADVAALRAATA